MPARLCTRCGQAPAVEGRASCEPCLEKRRAADRARATPPGKAAGLPYGGANAEAKRRAGRAKSKRCQKERLGSRALHPLRQAPSRRRGEPLASTCRDKRQAAERRQYLERARRRALHPVRPGRCSPACRAAGPAPSSRSAAIRRNARTLGPRALYLETPRPRGCVHRAGAPSQGASRCPPCAERSYHGSQHFKGIPVWDPSFTVIELDTGRELGTFGQRGRRGALCLVFEKLGRDQVEVVTDASPMSSFTAWT